MIHVAYRLWGGDGFFAKMCGTSMLSIFENTKEKITVHIMHNDRLTPDNRGKLCYIAGQYNQHVKFHNVEEIAESTLRKFEEAHPTPSGINASWYPLITHEVFPNLDKLIFLGADTIFNLDIGELWEYDLDEKHGVAAVPEYFSNAPITNLPLCINNLVNLEDYFNADVLLIKPNFFRDNLNLILEGCKFIHQNKYLFYEQDVLNYLFSKKFFKLPGRFNYIVMYLRKSIKNPCIERAIYHFAGPKPDLNADDIYNRLYFEYFLKTPWATADMFGNIDKELQKTFRQTVNNSKETLLYFTNLLARRQRAFFVEKNNIDAIKNIFAVKDDELIIDAAQPDALKTLFDEMNKSKGEKVFFMFVGQYGQLWQILVNQNFVEGVDFINAMMFLSERHGFKSDFDTKPIVQAI